MVDSAAAAAAAAVFLPWYAQDLHCLDSELQGLSHVQFFFVLFDMHNCIVFLSTLH
jgi:hypothetical protein